MQGRKISKRLAVFLASLLTIVITGCIGFAFATTMTSQAATNDVNITPITEKAGLASVITIVGGENGSEKIDTSVTLSHAQFLMTPISENNNDTPGVTSDDTFEILVNPKGTATAGNGILLSFDPYEDGDGTKSIMYCVGTKKFYKAVVDEDEEDSGDTQGNRDVAFMLPLEEITAPAGWENATKDITYNKTAGVISIKDTRPYRYTGITVYNFVTKDKITKDKTYYGALTETVDGTSTVQKLNSSTNKVVLEQDGKDPITGYLMNVGTSQLNGVLNQMKCNGGEEGFLSYQVNSLSLYSVVTNSANKVVFAVKLEKGSDYSVSSDNTIVLSDSVLGDKILVISDVSPTTGVQNPVLINKAKDSLTFAPAVNHTYELYASASADTPIATISKPTDGVVKFTGLNSDTIYYIQYVLKTTDGTKYPSQRLRYKTASATEPTAFHFKKGETYDVMVSVGDHWKNPSNAFNIQGGGHFSLGHTLFNATINYFWDQDPRKEAVAQLSNLFNNRTLQVSCITPGAGYSTGNSKWGFAEIVEADEQTGRVTLLVYMSGNWKVNGRSIQNVAGNITATTPTFGRIAIQKKTMTQYEDIVKHNDVVNTNYTLAGATFEVFYASDTARTNPVDILITDEAGEAESTDLSPGDYVVVETVNPKGYYKLDDNTAFPVTVVAGKTTELDNPIYEEPERATFELQKTSTDSRTIDNDYYSFEGIEYTLTGQNFGHTYTIKLDKDGNGSASNIAYDVYDLRETKTNKWYKKHGDNYDDDDAYNNIHIDANATDRALKPVALKKGEVKDEPEYVYIDLNKKSMNPAITAHNTSIYSLLGAKYEIICKTPGVKNKNTPSAWLPEGETDNIIETGIDKVNGMHSTNPLDGYGRSVKLYLGDYEVKEISGSESKSFALDPVTYSVPRTKWAKFASNNLFENVANDDVAARTYTVKQEDKASGTCTTSGKGDLQENPDVDFSFYIDKHDDLNDSQTGEGAADLSAIFEVRYYNVTPSESTQYNSDAPFDVWYLKTDSNGKASFDDLLERNADGSIKTVSGPDGDVYGVGKTFEGVRAENGNTAPYKYEQNKVNASTGNKFQSVKNNNGRIYVKKNSAGEFHAVIPVGIVEIEEVVAPEGYRYESGSLHGRDSGGVDDNGYPYRWTDAVTPAKAKVHKIYNREVTSADSDYASGRFDTIAMDAQSTRSAAFRNGKVSDHIYRSDIQVQKVDGDSSHALPYIPFLVTSETTGEQHVIVMNEQGYYNSESSARAQTNGRKGYDHSYNTNINDKLLSWKDGTPYISDPSKLNYESGTYFFGYGPKKGADMLVSGSDPYVNLRNMMFNADGSFRVSDGAFPYDNYTMQEIRIPAFDKNGQHYKGNENMTLQNRPFSISLASMTSSPYEIDDWEVSISTTATDSNGSQIGAIMGDTVTITDTVTYSKLDPGTADAPKKYVMTGTLMNRKTGQPLTYEGKTFTVSKEFTPQSAATHSIALDFVVPSAAVMGTSTVVYEECKLGVDVVATHKVLEDEFQTVSYPVIHTTATDSVTDDHYGQIMNETITVVDKVKCEGLLVGKTYTVSGTLMDKATGADLKDADGNTFTATTQFVCDSIDQTVEIKFEVPRSVIAGKTVVAFESVYYDNTLVGIHADINDEDQTVTYPDIHTTATDNVTGMHVGCDDYAVLINDVVKYDNLVLDGSYELTGTLMDKATGESLKDEDGKEITASAKFVAGQKQEILPVQVPVLKTISVDKKADDKDANTDVADSSTEKEPALGSASISKGKYPDGYSPSEIAAAKAKARQSLTNFYNGLDKLQHYVATEKTMKDGLEELTKERPELAAAFKKVFATATSANAKDIFEEYVIKRAEPAHDNEKVNSFLDGTRYEYDHTMYSLTLQDSIEMALSALPNNTMRSEFKDMPTADQAFAAAADLWWMETLQGEPTGPVGVCREVLQNYGSRVADKIKALYDKNATTFYRGSTLYTLPTPNEVSDLFNEYATYGTSFDKANEERINNILIQSLGSSELREKAPNEARDLQFELAQIASSTTGIKKSILYIKAYMLQTYNQEFGSAGDNNNSNDNTGNNGSNTGNNNNNGNNSSSNNGENGNADNSGNITSSADKEQVVIEYKSVTPNVTLADPVINGNYASGEVLVSFVVPRSVLEGKTTVVFEELEYVLGTAPDSPDNGDEPSKDSKIPIAEHEDINDEGQSVHYPMIHTLAHNNADVDINKVIPALAQIRGIWDELKDDTNVADALRKFHIIPLGTIEFNEIDILALFDKDACTDRDFNEKPITYDEVMALLKAPEATYNPIFDRNNKQAQINMEDNTITFVDVIEYENLLVGETYVAEGVIMDKATESPIIDGASNQEVRASVEFVPEKPNGTVEVEFTFDATAIGLDFTLISANMEEHKDIVVFEEMKIKGNNVADELITVARHQDINDYNQTMAAGNFPADELVETGTEVIETVLSSLGELAGPLALVFAANAAALIYIMRDRRRKEIV